jgi:RNA polymerase sigma-70 factor (ECF subfamily)
VTLNGEPSFLVSTHVGGVTDFGELAERYRAELLVHCYLMLGSMLDAEDLVQESLLRAWRRLETFEGRASFRAWLYRIATNACLNALASRRRRSLPQNSVPESSPTGEVVPPSPESIWLEPFPDSLSAGDSTSPEARYEALESVSLAFLAVLQLLTPRQRAALILRDVLDWPAIEAAEISGLSVSALNSALFAMPPSPSWYRGLESVRRFLAVAAFAAHPTVRWQLRPTRANGRPAFGVYQTSPPDGAYQPFGIQTVLVADGKIREITTFTQAALLPRFGMPS